MSSKTTKPKATTNKDMTKLKRKAVGNTDNVSSQKKQKTATVGQTAAPTPVQTVVTEDEEEEEEPTRPDGSEAEEPEEDEEIQLRLMKGWTSPIYAFYNLTARIGYKSGRRYHSFQCGAKGCKKEVRRFLNGSNATSTSNLIKHAHKCFGLDTVNRAKECGTAAMARDELAGELNNYKPATITASFKRQSDKGAVSYMHRQHTKTETRCLIVCWCAKHGRPFKIVKDEEFLILMKTGRPTHYVPSPATVSRDVRQVFVICRRRVAALLQNYNGRLSFESGCWTSPNHHPFMAVVVHVEHEGQPLTMLLNAIVLPKSHSGNNMAAAFNQLLKEFQVAQKMLGMTCDNASANNKMIEEMGVLMDSSSGTPSHTGCFAHVIVLVAKLLLRQFDRPPPKKKTGEGKSNIEEDDALRKLAGEIEDEEEATCELLERELREQLDDKEEDGWVNELAQLDDLERMIHDEDILPVRKALIKIRKSAYKILFSSTKMLPHWKELCEDSKLKVRKLLRNIRTRWNSTYDMLELAIEYRKVVDTITVDRDMRLREYELTALEWTTLEQLADVLKILKDTTLFFSRKDTPSLTMVIPAMDHIVAVLASEAVDKMYNNAVRSSLAMVRRTLNRYYSKTDMSETYRIAMVLHPRHKLEYLRQAGWQAEWIKTAEELIRTEFEASYASESVDTDATPHTAKTV